MRTLRAALLVSLALVSAIHAPRSAVFLNPSPTPAQSAFGVLGNGGITTIVPHGNVTYIGGNFDELAAITGAFARLDTTDAHRIAPLVEITPGDVRASASDGAGGVFVGGTFRTVAGLPRAPLVHILADGSLDSNFTPPALGGTVAVNALAVSDDGATLYIGGGFDGPGPQGRHNLAAVQTATGALTVFNPAGIGTDGQVFALAVSGAAVYVGGQFTKLGGQIRNGLAKVDARTGGDLGWVPNPTFNNGGGLIMTLAVSGNTVFAGGVFTNIGGQPIRHLAKLSATDGTASAAFAPAPSDIVTALAVNGGTLYAGGSFATIGGQTRPCLAQLDANTGAPTPFDARLVPTDGVRALAVDGGDLFVGGFLTTVGGQPRVALAKVDGSTGAVRPFDARIGGIDPVSVKTLAISNGAVYAGGNLFFVNRVTRHGIAALDADGVPTAFDPDAGPGGPNSFNNVNAIAVTDTAIYLGGDFTTMGGQPRNRVAKVSLDGTLDPTFNPNATGGHLPGIDAIVVTPTDVYVGGDFSTIGGQPRLDLARLNPVTGLVDGGRQSFDPDPLDGIKQSRIHALQVSGDAVYAAGDFTTIGGIARSKIAKISGATGDADVQFDAHVSGGSELGPGVFDIVLARGTLYVAGDFSNIGGAARNNVATLNPPTGAEVTGFNPNVTGGQRPGVYSIAVTDDEVYIGGRFELVGGATQGQIARLDKTGALTPFAPQIHSGGDLVLALAVGNGTLYAGGLFNEVNGRPRPGYAQFPGTGGSPAAFFRRPRIGR